MVEYSYDKSEWKVHLVYIVSVAPLATSACTCRIDPFTLETHVLLPLSALFSISTTTQLSTANRVQYVDGVTCH